MDKIVEDLRINVLKADHSIDVGTIIKKRFVLENKIGQGGMGTVYKARDIRREEANSANPYLAIKIVNDKFKQHPKAFTTLQHEAHKAQSLNHDNIIQVHDFDRDDDVAYITMEYLKGITLDKLMKTFAIHGLTYQQKLDLLSTVANALVYAHKQGCVHGDLKPSNIFITNDNIVKIIDFGLANVGNSISNDKQFDTKELQAFTPAYASQEINAHQTAKIADDVYAFACVAYEFLTGTHPYKKQSAKQAHQQKLQPMQIQYMPKHQWRALRKALSTDGHKREITMQQLLNTFTNTRNKRHYWWWITGSLLILVALFIVNQLDPII